MSGDDESLYVSARRVLLDALDALSPQKEAMTLVGAQAIYLQVGESDLALSPHTKDADIALDPNDLSDDPKFAEAVYAAGFIPVSADQIGSWQQDGQGDTVIPVDFLVPARMAAGGRAARLGLHGDRVARRVNGLEGAVVDRTKLTIAALEPLDPRTHDIWVAGPAALLVAKLHKIAERQDKPERLKDKDALDLFRLLRGTTTQDLSDRLLLLIADKRSARPTHEAIAHLRSLFADTAGTGCQMLARAVFGVMDEEETAQACSVLTLDLLDDLEAKGYLVDEYGLDP